jgi:hypothetical protein
MVVYIYSDPNTVKFFIDYINSIIINYNDIVLISNFNKLLLIINNINNKINNDIIIFMQSIPNIDISNIINNIYILNTEQLTREGELNRIQCYIANNIKIIDYSKSNIYCLKSKNINNNILYIPYLVNYNEIYNYDKIYDIAYIGHFIDERNYRMNIINSLNKSNIKTNEIKGFDIERDNLLFKYKILLNIHYNEEYNIFEQMRCNRCIFNKVIVITQKSIDIDFELKEYIIECEYNNLVATTISVINNYTYYYNKLFANFDIDKISKNYLKIADKAFNNIKMSQ